MKDGHHHIIDYTMSLGALAFLSQISFKWENQITSSNTLVCLSFVKSLTFLVSIRGSTFVSWRRWMVVNIFVNEENSIKTSVAYCAMSELMSLLIASCTFCSSMYTSHAHRIRHYRVQHSSELLSRKTKNVHSNGVWYEHYTASQIQCLRLR